MILSISQRTSAPRLRHEEGLSILLITHDFGVRSVLADRVAVMYLGKVVVTGNSEAVWSDPRHPHTRAPIDSVPLADGSGRLPADLPGAVPNPADPSTGCRFHPRCPVAFLPCDTGEPLLTGQHGDGAAACRLYPVDVQVPA